MKSLSILALLLSLSAAHATETHCYPLQPNDHGYEELCTEIDSEVRDAPATLIIRKADTAFYAFRGERKYFPRRQVRVGKEHDIKTFPQALVVSGEGAKNGVEIEAKIYLFIDANYPNQCEHGMITVFEPNHNEQILLRCPKNPWEAKN